MADTSADFSGYMTYLKASTLHTIGPDGPLGPDGPSFPGGP